jgi:uncharacterized protein
MILNNYLSVAALCMGLAPVTLQAASFDCTRASAAAEIAVCSNASLNRLDEDLAVQYRSVLRNLPPRRAELVRQDQRTWIDARDSCGADVRCLRSRYEERSARLDQY